MAQGELATEPLAELSGLTAEGIRRAPKQLQATKAALQAQLLELASGSTATFIESADCVKRVHKEVARVAVHLEALDRHLPNTSANAKALLVDAQTRIDARQRSATLLARQVFDDVQELLEQPQLMDTCVRNGFVDEALELEAAARSRAAVHKDVPIMARVASEVCPAHRHATHNVHSERVGRFPWAHSRRSFPPHPVLLIALNLRHLSSG